MRAHFLGSRHAIKKYIQDRTEFGENVKTHE